MNKTTLNTFIEKYNLNGTIEAVKLVSDGKTIKTSFVSEDKTLAGSVTAKDFGLDAVELCVFDTAKFTKFLSILDNDITIVPEKIDDRLVSIKVADTVSEVSFMLSDPSVIPAAPKIKDVKEFQVEIPINADFISRFTKAKNSLPDVDSFTILTNKKGDKLEMIIGYSSVNSNRIKLEIVPTVGKDKLTKPISFNANHFREVLNKNRDSSGAIFKIAEAGISQISFSNDLFESNYYLIKKNIEA